MKRRIRLTSLAESDLTGIWLYTCERWGAGQADEYLDKLDGRIAELAANPEIGSSRELVRHGYRVLLINSHAVYYTATEAEIHIVRVLHGRMDPLRRL